MKHKEFLKGFFLATVLFVAGIFCCCSILWTKKEYEKQYEVVYSEYEQQVINRIHYLLQLLDNQCIFDYSEEELIKELSKVILQAPGDKYTRYIELEDTDTSCGAGFAIDRDEQTSRWVISEVFLGSNADEQGVMAGDELLEVDQKSIAACSLEELEKMLSGERGEMLNLTVYRETTKQKLSFAYKRDEFVKNTIYYKKVTDDIGYMQIVHFEGINEYQVKCAYAALEKQGVKGILLDLRNNSGGSVDAARNLCNLFLDEMPLFKAISKNGSESSYTSSDGCWDIPLVCLINKKSASSSEIFSGVLQYYKRAELVGTQSFGKGIMQNSFFIGDKEMIQVTTARIYYPDGSSIHGVGLTPDYVVEAEEEAEDWKEVPLEKDAQLQKAIMVMQEKLSGK